MTGIKGSFVDGVAGKDVLDKVLPPGDVNAFSLGNRGSWRAHLNALQQYVTSGMDMLENADFKAQGRRSRPRNSADNGGRCGLGHSSKITALRIRRSSKPPDTTSRAWILGIRRPNFPYTHRRIILSHEHIPRTKVKHSPTKNESIRRRLGCSMARTLRRPFPIHATRPCPSTRQSTYQRPDRTLATTRLRRLRQ